MSQTIIGVNVHQLPQTFDRVLASALRANPHVLVVVARVLSDENMRDIARTHGRRQGKHRAAQYYGAGRDAVAPSATSLRSRKRAIFW